MLEGVKKLAATSLDVVKKTCRNIAFQFHKRHRIYLREIGSQQFTVNTIAQNIFYVWGNDAGVPQSCLGEILSLRCQSVAPHNRHLLRILLTVVLLPLQSIKNEHCAPSCVRSYHAPNTQMKVLILFVTKKLWKLKSAVRNLTFLSCSSQSNATSREFGVFGEHSNFDSYQRVAAW